MMYKLRRADDNSGKRMRVRYKSLCRKQVYSVDPQARSVLDEGVSDGHRAPVNSDEEDDQGIANRKCSLHSSQYSSPTSSTGVCSSPRRDGVVKAIPVPVLSTNPYEDFKASMHEMINKLRLYRAAELEELLDCYLLLNPRNVYMDTYVENPNSGVTFATCLHFEADHVF